MTFLETTKLLEFLAQLQPNINGIVETGDVFDLNKDEYQQKYSAFCATPRTHTVGLDYTTYSYTLYYVDRLTLDKSNKTEIQSTGIEFFHNLIATILHNYPEINVDEGTITTFTERFTAECAGAYMDIDIIAANSMLCPIEFYKEPVPVEDNCLTFTNIDSGISTISIQKVGEASDVNIEYSLDNGLNWNEFVVGETTISLDVDESVKLRGFNSAFAASTSDYNNFVMTGSISASGDITSLLNGEGGDVELVEPFVFTRLFSDCTSLVDAPDMPSKMLSDYCYYFMFYNCTNLTECNVLPAANLTNYCYYSMFRKTGMVYPPHILARNYAEYSCYNMFRDCTALKATAAIKAAYVPAYSCYIMYYGCTALETVNDIDIINTNDSSFQSFLAYHSTLKKISLPGIKRISGDSAFRAFAYTNTANNLEEVEFPNLGQADGNNILYNFFGVSNSPTTARQLKVARFPKLKTITGTTPCTYMFQYQSNLNEIDFSSLDVNEQSGNTLQNMFYNSTNVKIARVSPKCLRFNANAYNLLRTQVNLTSVELSEDADDNIYLNTQPLLDFNSVKSVLEHCNNDNMNGKSVTFYTSGLTVTDDAEGTLNNLRLEAELKGCSFFNLNII